jgi:hypothetical protein
MPLWAFSSQKTPSAVIAQFYNIYKSQNFRKALPLTLGKERDKVQQMLTMMKRNFGRPPTWARKFISRIDDLKIISENIQEPYARVDVIWILKIRDKDNPHEYQLKVHEIAYALKKQDHKWYIIDSRFINEHILYDYREVHEKYKKAKELENKKRK